MKLPRSLDELAGLRAARWTRESTSGQFDAFGPEAQREQQDRAIGRYALNDSGIAWTVAHSGRTIGNTDQFRDMLTRAGRDFDVLVAGYVSRFARDARTAWNARHDLHAAGACILFADERILTSDDEAWDSWAREAVEAESYSRKLARRIGEGYAAKRRRLGEPGGRPPLGFVRAGAPPCLQPEEGAVMLVRACFAAAAAGAEDRRVAHDLRLSLHRVRGTLTNSIYVGRLRDGSPASVEPIIDRATWDRVQRLRAMRNARAGRPSVNRTYALPMLRCEGCGRRLVGDSGRYRHLDPCAAFSAARRPTAHRNRLVRTKGYSQPASLYEGWVADALRETSLAVGELTQAAEVYRGSAPVDELALRRIARARERALARYATTRDLAVLERDMARLDEEEKTAKTPPQERPAWSEVLAVLKDLPAMWREAEPADRKGLAEAHIEDVTALGARRMTVRFHGGVQAVVMVGAKGLGTTITVSRTPHIFEVVRSA